MNKIKAFIEKRQTPDGAVLPQEKNRGSDRWRSLIALFITIFILSIIIANASMIVLGIAKESKGGIVEVLTKKITYGELLLQAINPLNNHVSLYGWFITMVFSAGLTILASMKINYVGKQVAYGQKGDSRLTTAKELDKEFTSIPEKKKEFKGYGGIPISHYKNKYYIDTQTNHSIIVGTSRSGKGQTEVVPLIDNLSRAENKSSMVLNDPKGELYAGASDILRKRGYNVYLLNMADGSKSMAYNPLALVLEKWLQGDTESALQLINSITYTLFHEKDAGSNAWVYNGAQSAVNGMIIAVIEYCMNPKNFPDSKAHPEKVTLNNIIDMTNELMIDYTPDPDNQFKTALILDEYFKHLPQGSFAKRAYASMAVAPEKGKASIVQTILERLNMFVMPKMARMTSTNSIALKSIGFPKYLNFSVGKDMANKHIYLRFYKAKKTQDEKGRTKYSYDKKCSAQYVISVNFGGFVEYNFADKLNTGDKVEVAYRDLKSGKEQKASWFITLPKDIPPAKKSKKQKNNVELREDLTSLGVEDMRMVYDDKPTAIFMKIPDYDSSNNKLASIFVSQLYSELAKQCSFVAGGKTIKRIHMIFDEFGNMESINDMDQIMTVSAGRNILFDLFIQSYQQLYSRYGNESGNTIKENGQNKILIKTTDYKTLEEFSNMAGNYTVEGGSVNKDKNNLATNYNASADSVKLLTVERLSQMLRGESLVLRPLSSSSLQGKDVRPYPIFNKGDHKMPYAYQLLSDDFDLAKDPNLLEVEAPHANLDLSTLSINWESFSLFDNQAHQAFLNHTSSEKQKQSDDFKQAETGSNKVDQGKNQEQIKREAEEARLNSSLFMNVVRQKVKTGQISIQVGKEFEEAFKEKDESRLLKASSSVDKSIADQLKKQFDQEIKG